MPTSRISARVAPVTTAPRIDRDDSIVASFLSDAAHVAGGHAAGVCFPRTEGDVAVLVAGAERVLPVGAQSSLTGGATPRGELIVSTRALGSIGSPDGHRIQVGAGVPLSLLQKRLAASGLYYPAAPTHDGAFVGGTIATNAAGPTTFKYGSTRRWVDALTIVLPSGDIIDVARGDVFASADGWFEIVYPSGPIVRVPVPTYVMPNVAKLSAGYYARPGMDLIDLFIGAEGTLGIVTAATLRVVPLPRRCLALITCRGDGQALSIAAALRAESVLAPEGTGPLDAAAIEYIDAQALAILSDEAFTVAGVRRPPPGSALLLAQFEIRSEEDATLARLHDVLEASGVEDDPSVATVDDERGAERLFSLREAVPTAVNSRVGAASVRDARIEKTAGDMVVPFERLADAIALYRRAFEQRGLDYAIWGHLSDGNLHPNVIPRTADDVRHGREALLEIAHGVMEMGGSPLAEHGVGRSALKQRLLRELYGRTGIDQMRAVKRALDPNWKLAPGVLFPVTDRSDGH